MGKRLTLAANFRQAGHAWHFGSSPDVDGEVIKIFSTTILLAAALLLAGGSAASADTTKLVERATTDAVLDPGAKGDGAGDVLTFANELYDDKNTKLVAIDNGWCIRTVPGKAWECTWIATLAKGQITVVGAFLDAGDAVLAITGGTGAYASARGEMKLHAPDARGSEYDFTS